LLLSSKKYGVGIRDPGFKIQDPGSRIQDPGSGIRKKPIPYPESRSRGQKAAADPGSQIRIRNTGQCCGTGIYPGSRILIFTHSRSRIPDLKTATKERGEKRFVVKPFFVATNFT
jgi:hypothetical protein